MLQDISMQKNKDDILGFVHIRDLYNQKINENKIELEEMMRDIIYIWKFNYR